MKRSSRWRRRLTGFLLLILALLALGGVSALVIRFAPPWLVSTKGLSGTARLDELSRVRVALLVLVLGALAAGLALYLVRRSARDRREESRERQLTERFMRAVDQLGHPALDVRLGGIYSLERIARESRENHGPIIEILAAFVREQAQWPAAAAGGHGETRPRPATDVQASLTILGRRVVAHDTDAPIALSYSALAGATLTGAHLERALLTGSNLEGADLFKAHLNAADLEGANLRGAGLLLANLNDTVLWGANLEGARLYGANLEGAALKGANLKDAGLTGANLKDAGLHGAVLAGADLTGANLEGAGLEGANLEGANLQGANLRGAVLLNALYDDATIWPNGLDVAAQGAVRRAWPPEPAPWVRETEEAIHPPAPGWPNEGPGWPHETRAPQTQIESPPAPAAAGAPHEAEPSDESEPSDDASPASEPEPPPPSEWPHSANDEPRTPDE
jgi:uncharacterized protein YjbI with pentapeptide repeats/membrane protein implicated in regulation of membrane protease activity